MPSYKFPGGPPADWPPSPPSEEPRRRGRPPKRSSGTWEGDDLRERVEDILGDSDDREERGPEIAEALSRLARDVLGPDRFTDKRRRGKRIDRHRRLESLARKAIAREEVASDEIVRQLRVWRHDLTDPAVRRVQSRKPVAHDFTALVLKYGAERPLLDADGKPATDENGRPILARPPVRDDAG